MSPQHLTLNVGGPAVSALPSLSPSSDSLAHESEVLLAHIRLGLGLCRLHGLSVRMLVVCVRPAKLNRGSHLTVCRLAAQFVCRSQCDSTQTSTQTSPLSMTRHLTSETAAVATLTAALSASSEPAVQGPQAVHCLVKGDIVPSADTTLRIRQFEIENGRLLMRLSLLLKQTHLGGTNDGRKWRHNFLDTAPRHTLHVG